MRSVSTSKSAIDPITRMGLGIGRAETIGAGCPAIGVAITTFGFTGIIVRANGGTSLTATQTCAVELGV